MQIDETIHVNNLVAGMEKGLSNVAFTVITFLPTMGQQKSFHMGDGKAHI